MTISANVRNAVVAGVIAFVISFVIALAQGNAFGGALLTGISYLVGTAVLVFLAGLLVQAVRGGSRRR